MSQVPKYRIVPFGQKHWRVEKQTQYLVRVGPFWNRKWVWIYGTWEIDDPYEVFNNEVMAEKYIDSEREKYFNQIELDKLILERARTIQPREYP